MRAGACIYPKLIYSIPKSGHDSFRVIRMMSDPSQK